MNILSRFRRAARCLFSEEEHLRSGLRAKGSVEVIMRYSELYPNSKLRGEVAKYYELGSNLVVLRGRFMSAGLWAGAGDPGTIFTDNKGLNEETGPNDGWVVRGMAVGDDGTAEADEDTALKSVLGGSSWYYPIDLITFTAYPNTDVIFGRTFAPTEPTATANIREFGLYTGAPGPDPVATTPPGPTGGPYLVARKTHGLITKTSHFTMQLLWTIEF